MGLVDTHTHQAGGHLTEEGEAECGVSHHWCQDLAQVVP